jgi:enterochelin esterase-like enzyme
MLCEAVSKMTGDGSCAEMIIVQPNATEYKGGYNNRDDWKYQDYFFNELMPAIEKNFRTINDKGHRAIGGLSMGAGGTYQYALTRPELFCAAYAISGHSSIDVTTLSPEEQEKVKTVAWTIDCGGQDIAFDNAVKTYQQMKKIGMNCQFRSEYGVHATFYWYDGLCKMQTFFTRHFSDQCK